MVMQHEILLFSKFQPRPNEKLLYLFSRLPSDPARLPLSTRMQIMMVPTQYYAYATYGNDKIL